MAASTPGIDYVRRQLSGTRVTARSQLLDSYDFIVVGGGTAGCTLAARLSEDPSVTVLLLEAGGDDAAIFNVAVPVGCGMLQRDPKTDWMFRGEVQENQVLQRHQPVGGLVGQMLWPRGKLLGGCSSINYMAYVRGSPADFNGWAEDHGALGWSYAEVLQYFKRSEALRGFEGDSAAALGAPMMEPDWENWHSTSGALSVEMKSPVNRIARAFVASAAQSGHAVGDYNAGPSATEHERASLFQTMVRKGTRCSSSLAFIRPATREGRANLHVALHAKVGRVLLDDAEEGASPRAVGVRVIFVDAAAEETHGAETVIVDTKEISARREVVLAAGAIQSPQILLLSGIGPEAALKAAGVPVAVANEEVGRHMQDHLFCAVRVLFSKGSDVGAVKASVVQDPGLATARNVGRYLWSGTGPLSSSAYDATLFFRSGLGAGSDGGRAADLQLGVFCGPGNNDVIQGNLGMQCDGYISAAELENDVEGITFVPTLLHPRSTGVVSLVDANPLSAPRIDGGYFTDVANPALALSTGDAARTDGTASASTSSDARTLARGCMKAVELLHQPAFRALLPERSTWTFNVPVEHVNRARARLGMVADATRDAVLERAFQDERFWIDYALDVSSTLYHPVGTCGIGRVIDPELRVIGVRGLRVADASSMPEITSGNTAAPVFMIAEKCAQLMADAHALKLSLRTGVEAAAGLPPTAEDGSAGGPSNTAMFVAGALAGAVGIGAAMLTESKL